MLRLSGRTETGKFQSVVMRCTIFLLGQVLVGTLNQATCKVCSPKAIETSIHENVTHIVFFIVSEISFFGFIEAFDLEQ